MWISKKQLKLKIFEAQTKASEEEWKRHGEQRQNETIWKLENRVTALEIKTGIKTEPKSCGCCSETVVAV